MGLVLVLAILAALTGCGQSADEPGSGQVTVYNADLGAENPWSGMVVGHEGSRDDEYIMLTQPTGPVDLNPGEGTGMYLRSGVYVHQE